MKALASEMTQNFNIRLKSLGIVVKELTGDMQLTKSEIASTQLLVTTPEKWDLVTRKGDGKYFILFFSFVSKFYFQYHVIYYVLFRIGTLFDEIGIMVL